jgi:hypothetical protein
MRNKPYTPRVGEYVVITDHPRIDCIGKVVRANDNGTFVVSVPNWTADGMPHEFRADVWTVAKATAKQAKDAAVARG